MESSIHNPLILGFFIFSWEAYWYVGSYPRADVSNFNNLALDKLGLAGRP